MTAAALVTKRQPSLLLPSGNHIPQRAIPARRPLPPPSPLRSSLSNRRASSPYPTSETVHRVRFGSSSGLPATANTTPSTPHYQHPQSLMRPPFSKAPSPSPPPLFSQQPTTQPNQLTDTESISGSSRASSPKKPDDSSSSGSESDDQDDDASERSASTTIKYTRRRSRAVLYHLSGRFDKRNKQSKLNFKRVVSIHL